MTDEKLIAAGRAWVAHVADGKLTDALAAMRQALGEPAVPLKMSGVAQRKARDLAAQGYTAVGYTMTKPGDRTAVLIDAAVRWLTPDQQHKLMFVEGSTVIAQQEAP